MAERDLDAAIAVTRFGLGAKPGEIAAARVDPRGFLLAQIRRDGADQPQPGAATAQQRLAEFRDYQKDRQAAKSDPMSEANDPVKVAQKLLRTETAVDFTTRARLGATTDASFRERWTLFWANHFTVSATKLQIATVVGPYEQEAIRPHVFGRFEDLLVAAETHPAMLLYLDQAQSVGPDSQLVALMKSGAGRGQGLRDPQAARLSGLNENLAREILELHTLGVDGGYTQEDVTEFARAMTGLSVGGLRDRDQLGAPIFRSIAHEPGARTVLGRRYPAGGQGQTAAILADLAAHPSTARFVCTKLARHFVADAPPPSLVARLEQTWTSSGGDLARVAEALVRAPEAWTPEPAKFKTPYEFMISAWRSVGGAPRDISVLAPTLNAMGQKPFSPPSPKGWPDETAAWASPASVVARMAWSQSFADRAIGDRDPVQLANDALGVRLSPRTATAIARAESRAEALALMLMSPEFQRR